MLRIALLTALLCLGCVSSADAAPLTLRDTGLSGNARSDAVRYLAVSADGHAVTVLDTRTGARRAIAAPGIDCGFTDIHRGTLLWHCEDPVAPVAAGVTFDPATGRVGTLAQAQPPIDSGAGPGIYSSIGDHWAGAVGPADATAREVASSLSALDPSYRPDEIGTPWAIAGPGYFTDAASQDKIHVAFKQPIDPGWTPPG
jgi:hypothetical protein